MADTLHMQGAAHGRDHVMAGDPLRLVDDQQAGMFRLLRHHPNLRLRRHHRRNHRRHPLPDACTDRLRPHTGRFHELGEFFVTLARDGENVFDLMRLARHLVEYEFELRGQTQTGLGAHEGTQTTLGLVQCLLCTAAFACSWPSRPSWVQ